MNPSLTRGEYGLLESVVEAKNPLRWLAADNLNVILNKTAHGLSLPLLRETLFDLFEKKWIESYQSLSDEPIKLSRPEIETVLCETSHPHQIYYGLTSLGGTVWEAFAQPDWNRFIVHTITCENTEDELAEFICADKKLLESYFHGIHHIGIIPKKNAIQYDTLEPWQATYWKELSRGFRIRFRCQIIKGVSWEEIPASYLRIYEKRWHQWN